MVSVPFTTPVTTPVVFTVAIAGLLLDQVPPVVASVKVVVEPTQVEFTPEIAATTGAATTVILVVTAVAHPAAFVTV